MQPVPVQMLSLFSADGAPQPVRFRFEDPEHRLHTVQITQVVDVRKVTLGGIEAYRFLCLSEQNGTAHLFELDYVIRPHRWRLRRRVY